ncbi:MAG: hypothetical protein NT161_02620 [Candidatus Nomurabacteria bacterium]|nr:hypothetical protein [Candidatus Nomurabacteria bacterium]
MIDLIILWIYKILLGILPVVLTGVLAYIAHAFWLHYVQANFISGIEWVLLEIVPPRDVLRSPRAMELFITNALYHSSQKSGLESYWIGAVWFWFSLEIVSIEGQVHFYIRVPSRVKSLIETQMYAQYPQAQVKEVEDYTLAVDEITADSKYNLWGCEFKFTKPDAYPLKTYIDYGLDKDPKEEYKVDPISPVVELFGSIGKGEQMWMQIVITPSKKKFHTKGTWFKSHDWVAESELQVRKALAEFTNLRPRPDGTMSKEIRAPAFMDEMIKGAARKFLKVGFDTGVRICYVAKREAFNMNNRRNMRLIFRQYAAPYSNELTRFNSTQSDAFATGETSVSSFFPATRATITRLSNRMLLEYREREFFHPPMRHKIRLPWPLSPYIFPNFFHHHIMIMNTEELATLWHFPGQILKVPTLERIESKEASPPTNLPT